MNPASAAFTPFLPPANPTQLTPHHEPALTHNPSSLRPHCLAHERLLLWLPANASPRSSNPSGAKPLSDQEIEHILNVIGASWSEATKELYSTGLLIFHVYCNISNIPDTLRAPVATNTFAAFLSSCAGTYAGSTVVNYAATVKAWHLLHGLEWVVKDAEYKALLEGTTRLAPTSSKRPGQSPFTVNILERFRLAMNLDNPQDTAIFACITCSFFCIARLGEFTVPAISKFDPSKHIMRAGVVLMHNHEGLPVMKFSLPFTKASKDGEETHCAPHNSDSGIDPKRALNEHFHINSHPTVTKHIDSITKEHPHLPNLKGHSLCIGGTLFYLLKGVPFDVVKTMGRWLSELFTLYLRHHALNMCRYILPPVR
ncbi:hypothetical protein BS17DRAFT_795523 [Gyrodon lividus]|nr:hypothetical protein BS17DRAFT_795523 [Gyrodon lividus]